MGLPLKITSPMEPYAPKITSLKDLYQACLDKSRKDNDYFDRNAKFLAQYLEDTPRIRVRQLPDTARARVNMLMRYV